MWAPQAYWQQLGCVCVRHDQRRFPINVPPGFPLPVVLLPAPATVLSEVSGPVQPSQCTTPHSAEVGWTAPRIRQAMSFAGVWNLEATLTEQDVKTAIFGIGFDPKQVSKATCVEGAFCVTFADLQSGLALAVALDDLDPKHDIFKDSNGGVRACVWPRPSSGVYADFFHEMPPDLEVFVARQAASQIAEGSVRFQ